MRFETANEWPVRFPRGKNRLNGAAVFFFASFGPLRGQEFGSKRVLRVLAILAFLSVAALRASTFTENFAGDPAANGWQIFGDPNLFRWDATNQNLRVTWDSSQTNSYFFRPLETILTRDDDFSLSFDLTFDDCASGTTSGKPFAAPTAIGFLDLDQATRTNFSRGAGINPTSGPRNLVEFNFFPSFDVFLPTIDQVIVSTNNGWLYNDDNLLEMTAGETFNIHMGYAAATRTLSTVISNNGAQYGLTQTIAVPAGFDFRVATLSMSSYSDADDIGSVLAHGVVDNFVVVTPPPPVEHLSGGFVGASWEVQFTSRSNWVYILERTTDFQTWMEMTSPLLGTGTMLTLTDANPVPGNAAYRVRAQRP